ncbi:unnamed protein product [Schistosoma mattheei]|uniref:Uncharacterized protein n=1 Tax=Schistosoma mattheei TaxID=31246 RepID=A0A183PM25_9TREM|nr:unnamed protein product [Schistosoma mattheei]
MEQCKFNEFHERVEAEITGIKASLSTRRAEIRQLKKHISDITSEKQALLENLFKAYNTLLNIVSLWKSTNGQLCQCLYESIQENVNEIVSNNCFTKNTWEASFDDVITTASQLSNNFNKEQLHNSLNQLIKTRTLLLKLRQELANKYADHLGGKIDCIVQ